MNKNKEKSVDEMINNLEFSDNFRPLTSWELDIIIKIIDFLNRIDNFLDALIKCNKSVREYIKKCKRYRNRK